MSMVSKVDIVIPSSGIYDVSPPYDDIFAISCDTEAWVSAFPYGYALDTQTVGTRFIGPAGTTITLYVFGYQDNPKGNHFNVYDSNGGVVFSDAAKYLRVIDQFSGFGVDDLSYWASDNENTLNATLQYFTDLQLFTYTHAEGTKCAVTIGPLVKMIVYADDWNHFSWYLAQCFKFTSTSITSTVKKIGKKSNTPFTIFNQYSNLIIDVTNY